MFHAHVVASHSQAGFGIERATLVRCNLARPCTHDGRSCRRLVGRRRSTGLCHAADDASPRGDIVAVIVRPTRRARLRHPRGPYRRFGAPAPARRRGRCPSICAPADSVTVSRMTIPDRNEDERRRLLAFGPLTGPPSGPPGTASWVVAFAIRVSSGDHAGRAAQVFRCRGNSSGSSGPTETPFHDVNLGELPAKILPPCSSAGKFPHRAVRRPAGVLDGQGEGSDRLLRFGRAATLPTVGRARLSRGSCRHSGSDGSG
jgi:hypothetical protein